MRIASIIAGSAAIFGAAALAAVYWPWLEARLQAPGPAPAISGDALVSGDFVLAVSWQPAFCETAPQKAECRVMRSNSQDATHLSLHGLWPEPMDNVYCDVSPEQRRTDQEGSWQELRQPGLEPAIAGRLALVMPGTKSLLERHEWIKHGTCSGAAANDYFAASIALVEALDDGGIGGLFASNVGRELSANDIRAAFDDAFGPGTGTRVTLECARIAGRTMISELRIAIRGEVSDPPNLAALLAAAPQRHRGCPGGEIDAPGRN